MTSVIGQRLIDALEPYMTEDLATYLDVVGGMLDEFQSYVNQYGEEDVWGPLLDIERCPVEGLPYLAQYLGERLPTGISEPAAREWIRDHAHMRRGTLEAIAHATQRSLTGTRTVQITERSGTGANPEDYLSVVTYEQETPDPDAVLFDLRASVPADLNLNYQALPGQTWGAVNSTYATWQAVANANANWADVAGAQSGSSVWDRPQSIP
jgi:hypothetical protein